MRCRIRRLSGPDAQACRIRRLSGPDAIDIYVDSEPQGTKGPQGTRNASMDQGGGRVDVGMSRMTVAQGCVSMSRIVHLLVRGLCGREVRLQSEAE